MAKKATVAAKKPAKSAQPKPIASTSKTKLVKPGSKPDSTKSAAKALKGKGVYKSVSKDDAQEIMKLLCERYPDADCELTFRNDFELLIAVILSAQTTDVRVNQVTPNLFARFPTPKALAEAPIEEVKEIIRSTGFFNAKAQNIQACAQGLVARFDGKVPRTVEELITLPGAGRKTANVVLGVVHNIPGWTVDTHVQRLCKRLGFSELEDPAKIEKELQLLFPEQDWTKYSITLIWHGRRCCEARLPNCPACPVNHLCPSALV